MLLHYYYFLFETLKNTLNAVDFEDYMRLPIIIQHHDDDDFAVNKEVYYIVFSTLKAYPGLMLSILLEK